MLAEAPTIEGSTRFGNIVARIVSGMPAQGAAGLRSAGDGSTVIGVGGWDPGRIRRAG